MRAPGSVVVVGGGVVGAACADFLARAGWKVTIVERGAFGGGCSAGNCGLVCPSHVLPLAEPGAIGRTIKALFEKNSPFSIRPRFEPALWSWLYHFARRCNERDMLAAARGIQPLLESSLELYRDLIPHEPLDCEWQARGLLFAYKDRAALDAYEATDRLLRESFHCPATKFNGEEAVALEPALRDGLAGAWYYEEDAHLRPDRLMASWRRSLEARGATIRERCAFLGFHGSDGSATAVATEGGKVEADAFVVATGAWTPLLNEHLGCRVPIQPGKGYSLTMPRPASCPAIPIIFPETRVVATPFPSGYRLGSTMEFAGYDASINPRRLNLLKEGARPYLREPYCEPVETEWFGWRPMTYDSLPIIDRTLRYSNVWIAAGHNMLGLSMAPATGKLVAELIGGTAPHVDPTPYRVGRF
ncbi:MAG TPA: FAD-dependent oxidoreductase [Isosphaeraceae bacterium]|nr:FAD-dependent oxidoreductase [Isosphaeraceae bacterium]